MFLCLFETFVRSQLENANNAWSPHKVKVINAIKSMECKVNIY